ncbi:hypothetical protein [Aeromicrobium sp. UC242_57]|uniref:hypothetical protein n=1 Tax=Aeromicrobium sp. UC242_57 TaxID=3374624 RepID=UPI00378BF304
MISQFGSDPGSDVEDASDVVTQVPSVYRLVVRDSVAEKPYFVELGVQRAFLSDAERKVGY